MTSTSSERSKISGNLDANKQSTHHISSDVQTNRENKYFTLRGTEIGSHYQYSDDLHIEQKVHWKSPMLQKEKGPTLHGISCTDVDTAEHEKIHMHQVENGSIAVVESPSSTKRKGLLRNIVDSLASITEQATDKDDKDVMSFSMRLQDERLLSKLVYVLSVVTVVSLSLMVIHHQWLLPYFFTVATPLLMMARFIYYWKLKYQYFLMDFCYFANCFCYAFIWVYPWSEQANVFCVAFGVANGPLLWSLFVFRNSLVFHSLDKITSMYIHLIPSLLTFVIRWYPDETAEKWHSDFSRTYMGIYESMVYLIAVPLGVGLAHLILHSIFVNIIMKPSEEYLTLYRHLTHNNRTLLFRVFNMFGPKFRYIMYCVGQMVFFLFTLSFSPIWYNSFPAHCAAILTFLLISCFNGASYYIDVFHVKPPSMLKVLYKSEI